MKETLCNNKEELASEFALQKDAIIQEAAELSVNVYGFSAILRQITHEKVDDTILKGSLDR